MPSLTRAARLAPLFAVTVLAACGGSDGDKGKDAHAAYVKSADAICAKASKIGSAMGQEFTQVYNQGDLAGAAGRRQGFQPAYRKHLDELARLQPPKGEEAKAKAIVAALNDRADSVSMMARALSAGNQAEIANVGKKQRELTEKAGKLATAYGFKVCGVA